MRDVAGLGLSLHNWWQRELANFKKGKVELERSGPIVYLKMDREILMGFENDRKGNKEVTKFYIHSPELLNEDKKIRFLNLFERRLNGQNSPASEHEAIGSLSKQEAKTYKKIFGNNLPYLMARTVKFEGQRHGGDYAGLSVIAPVLRLEGREGGLSENLFIYGRKGILVPLYITLSE